MMKKLLLLLGVLFEGLPMLLMLIDALHPQQCTETYGAGTRMDIPGETMVISTSTTAERLVLDVVRDPFDIPGYQMRPEHGHIHPDQAEGFLVVNGRAQVLIGDEVHTLGPGESVIVPPNTIHHWMALDEQPVIVEAFFEPPLQTAAWFVHFQQHIADDTMDLFQAAVISREFPGSGPSPVEPPALVWEVLSRVMAPLGRLVGYKPC
ncbi:MAG: cupin domain-containing protein [Pseudomonadota bacterium]